MLHLKTHWCLHRKGLDGSGGERVVCVGGGRRNYEVSEGVMYEDEIHILACLGILKEGTTR